MQPITRFLLASLCGLMSACSACAAGCLDGIVPDKTPFSETIKCFKEQMQQANDQLKQLPQLQQLRTDLKGLREALYNDVDAVYTISQTFTPQDIKNLGADKTLTYSQYIYADPKRHDVTAYIYRRQNSFNFKLCINATCKMYKNDLKGENLTPDLLKYPLKLTKAGVENAMLEFPDNVQLIELQPSSVNWDGGDVASLDGYIIVRRKSAGDAQ